jgi:NADH:ubiquinone oxidoreductase subunit 3 (subunit A)
VKSGRATKMLDNYFPVLVFILVGLGFGCVPILLGWLIAPNRPDSEKLSAFECGFVPFEDARMKFDVRYYLIAILFILFDLEIAFLFPWARFSRKSSIPTRSEAVWFRRNVRVHRHPSRRLRVCVGQGCAGLGMNGTRDIRA